MEALVTELPTAGPRRWLVLRCYVNPSGSIPDPAGDGARVPFSTYRRSLTDAGFEVIECPRLAQTKNAADIRLVLDAADALRDEVRYDEFGIASGDSDMTPLLLRLRAADRRTTVISASDTAAVLGAIADRVIAGEELLGLLDRHSAQSTEAAHARFRSLARRRYETATEPLNLSTLAHELRAELGPVVTATRWFGHGSFGRALTSLALPHATTTNHLLWNASRHELHKTVSGTPPEPVVPDPVVRVTAALELPRLGRRTWRPIYAALAAYVDGHDFHLTEATRWARDRVAETGVAVNRKAVSTVAHGASLAGSPLGTTPAPKADEIGAAFVTSLLHRAQAADVELSVRDIEVLSAWFGAPDVGRPASD